MIIDNSKILIKATLIDNKWIPIWEFKHSECDSGDVYAHKSSKHLFHTSEFQDVYYDINTKEIDAGIQIHDYPQNLKYKVGDEVLVEISHRILKKYEINEIIYEPAHHYIYWGEKAQEEYGKYVDQKLDFNKLYHIITYDEKYKIKGIDKPVYSYQICKLEE